MVAPGIMPAGFFGGSGKAGSVVKGIGLCMEGSCGIGAFLMPVEDGELLFSVFYSEDQSGFDAGPGT